MAKNNRIFIAFPSEDSKYRDFLVGQARNEKSPFSFVDMSVKEPWDEKWRTNCNSKIKGCDGLIFLVTSNLKKADGAIWEIKCAKKEGIPILGIYIGNSTYIDVPTDLWSETCKSWTWDNIAGFINYL